MLEFHEYVRLDIRYGLVLSPFFAEVGVRVMIIRLTMMIMMTKMVIRRKRVLIVVLIVTMMIMTGSFNGILTFG